MKPDDDTMTENQKALKEAAETITRNLSEQGRIIEAGWTGFALMASIGHRTDPLRAMELRKAFYAGALHLYSSILVILDLGDEPSEADLRRLDLISKELRDFEASLRPARN